MGTQGSFQGPEKMKKQPETKTELAALAREMPGKSLEGLILSFDNNLNPELRAIEKGKQTKPDEKEKATLVLQTREGLLELAKRIQMGGMERRAAA